LTVVTERRHIRIEGHSACLRFVQSQGTGEW
jgi:hypothetical protein